ncbi:hypothetical protein ACFQZ0_35395 [Streptomyces erythrogriseus]
MPWASATTSATSRRCRTPCLPRIRNAASNGRPSRSSVSTADRSAARSSGSASPGRPSSRTGPSAGSRSRIAKTCADQDASSRDRFQLAQPMLPSRCSSASRCSCLSEEACRSQATTSAPSRRVTRTE